jgi:hypothetical protein
MRRLFHPRIGALRHRDKDKYEGQSLTVPQLFACENLDKRLSVVNWRN